MTAVATAPDVAVRPRPVKKTRRLRWQRIVRHLLDSLTRAGIGLVIGGVLTLALGATAGLLRLGDDAIDPPVQMARMLPHLALVPLLITWVGIGESMKINGCGT